MEGKEVARAQANRKVNKEPWHKTAVGWYGNGVVPFLRFEQRFWGDVTLRSSRAQVKAQGGRGKGKANSSSFTYQGYPSEGSDVVQAGSLLRSTVVRKRHQGLRMFTCSGCDEIRSNILLA